MKKEGKGKRLNDDEREKLIADISTGQYSVRELSSKHGVSVATVQSYKTNMNMNIASIVSAGISYKTRLLSLQNKAEADAVTNTVDEKTERIMFFINSALQNQNLANEKINENSSLFELQAHAKITAQNKETVLGKSPETAISINNENNKKKNKLTVEFVKNEI